LDVRFAKLGSLPFKGSYYHAYIVATEPDNTRVYFRGGPNDEGPSGSASGSASGGSSSQESGSDSSESNDSGNSSSPGSGPGGEDGDTGPWGNLTTESGVYREGTVDWDPDSPPSQRLVNNDEPCESYLGSLAETMRLIRNAGIPYNPFSSNSNAVVSTGLKRAGIPLAKPPVLAPGWDTTLLN